MDFTASMQRNPIVASVNDLGRLDAALQSPCEIIFLLKGDIFSIPDVVGRIHQADKRVYVHFDLMEGFSREQVALRYLKEKANPDGIITTRVNLIKFAKEFEFSTIQRVFMLDSLSVETAIKSVKSTRPHAIELLPGITPGGKAGKPGNPDTAYCRRPIESKGYPRHITGGAVGISTTKEELSTYRACSNTGGDVMDKYVLALDQGTTSSRAILFDRKGSIVALAQKNSSRFIPTPAG